MCVEEAPVQAQRGKEGQGRTREGGCGILILEGTNECFDCPEVSKGGRRDLRERRRMIWIRLRKREVLEGNGFWAKLAEIHQVEDERTCPFSLLLLAQPSMRLPWGKVSSIFSTRPVCSLSLLLSGLHQRLGCLTISIKCMKHCDYDFLLL